MPSVPLTALAITCLLSWSFCRTRQPVIFFLCRLHPPFSLQRSCFWWIVSVARFHFFPNLNCRLYCSAILANGLWRSILNLWDAWPTSALVGLPHRYEEIVHRPEGPNVNLFHFLWIRLWHRYIDLQLWGSAFSWLHEGPFYSFEMLDSLQLLYWNHQMFSFCWQGPCDALSSHGLILVLCLYERRALTRGDCLFQMQGWKPSFYLLS